MITVYVEPEYPVAGTLRRIRALGKQAGISLNPNTLVAGTAFPRAPDKPAFVRICQGA